MVDKHGETGRMSVHFRADESGRVVPSHAEAVLDVVEEYTVQVPVAAAEEQGSNETSEVLNAGFLGHDLVHEQTDA